MQWQDTGQEINAREIHRLKEGFEDYKRKHREEHHQENSSLIKLIAAIEQKLQNLKERILGQSLKRKP